MNISSLKSNLVRNILPAMNAPTKPTADLTFAQIASIIAEIKINDDHRRCVACDSESKSDGLIKRIIAAIVVSMATQDPHLINNVTVPSADIAVRSEAAPHRIPIFWKTMTKSAVSCHGARSIMWTVSGEQVTISGHAFSQEAARVFTELGLTSETQIYCA